MLVVGHILRHDPRYRAVQTAVASGAVGEPVHAASRRSFPVPAGRRWEDRSSLTLHLAVHELDLLRWTVGHRIERVYAVSTGVAVPGLSRTPAIVAAIRFENGAVATLEVSWALPDAAGSHALSVVGTEGIAGFDSTATTVHVLGGLASPAQQSTRRRVYSGGLSLNAVSPREVPPMGGVFEGVDDLALAEMASFVGAVRGLTPPTMSNAEAVDALAAAPALDESAVRGAPVDVDSFAAESLEGGV